MEKLEVLAFIVSGLGHDGACTYHYLLFDANYINLFDIIIKIYNN